MLNPIADKLMVGMVLVMLVDNESISGVHTIAALIILSRDFGIWFAGIFNRASWVGLPVSQLAKIKTTAQMVALGFLPSWHSGAKTHRAFYGYPDLSYFG